MSSSTSPRRVLYRKCQYCRKIINTNDFEEHVSNCPFKPSTAGMGMLTCRGCNQLVKTTELLLHFHYEGVSCRKAYSGMDYHNIANLWAFNNSNHPNYWAELKTAWNINKKGIFTDVQKDKPWYCNACGKNFGNCLIDHHDDVPYCKATHKDLHFGKPIMKCKICSKTERSLLFHLTYNSKCREVAFNSLKEPEITLQHSQVKNDVDESELDQKLSHKEKIDLVAEKELLCIGCGGQFKRNTILKHLTKMESCTSQYSSAQFDELQKACKQSSHMKMRLWKKNRHDAACHDNQVEESYYEVYRKNKEPVAKLATDKVKIKPSVELIKCVACHQPFPINKILRHVSHVKECKNQYSPKDLHRLRQKCRQFTVRTWAYKQQREYVKDQSDKKLNDHERHKLSNYRVLKRKIEDLHLKCVQGIDMDKICHYKWEYEKVKVKSHETFQIQYLDKLRLLSKQFDDKIMMLEKFVENHFLQIKCNTSKWCFDDSVKETSKRLHEDMKKIDSNCEGILSKVMEEFHNELFLFYSGLKTFSDDFGVNIKLNPYKFKHQHKWEYESTWKKYENPDHQVPNEDEANSRDQFIMREVENKIKE